MVEETIKNKIDWRENITKKLPHNLIPKSASEILQKAIANAYRHGIMTKAGKLNPAKGDCSFESVLNNINYRKCFKKKFNKATNKYRWEWVTQLEEVQKQIGCIDPDKYKTIDWVELKTPGTYTTDISDLAMVAIANAFRHGIMTKAGRLNPAKGDCSFESVLNNINDRQWFTKKFNKATNKYRWEWVTQLEEVQKQIGCIDPNKYKTIDWVELKTPGTYTTDISDLAMVAIARGCQKDILIFNTSAEAHGPIYVIFAGQYEGGSRNCLSSILIFSLVFL